MKIKIHPLFVVLICVSIYFGNAHVVVSYMLSLFIHEMGHAAVAYKYKYELSSLCFMPYGAVINLKKQFMNSKHEILVALAGPLVNLVCCGFVVVLWWFCPVSYSFTYCYCFSSFITAIFNLLPLIPLDGSRVILAFFSQFRKRGIAFKVLKVLTLLVGIFLLILFVISAFFEINFSLALLGMFTIAGIFGSDEFIYTKNYLSKFKNNKTVLTKFFAVREDFKLSDVYGYLSPDYYLALIVVDENSKPIKTLYENEIIKLLVDNKW